MSDDLVKLEVADGVATVTLNRPKALNALSSALRLALIATFEKLQADPDVAVAILTGEGRAFCAGVDLKELGGEVDPASFVSSTDPKGNPCPALASFDRPLIVAVNGVAVTGGFELALCGDFIVAAESARFGDTHARVGLVPGWGLSQKLSRLIGLARAKEMSFTGNFLSAREAEAWGLVNRVVPDAELMTACRKLAADIRSCQGAAIRTVKRMYDEGFATTLEEGMRLEVEINAEVKRNRDPAEIAKLRVAAQERARGAVG
jgi:enoyl-CoA hydratase